MNAAERQEKYYAGVKMINFDLVKEMVLALFVVSLVVIGLAAALSSPDDPAVTIQTWATKEPVDFVTTAASELAGTSETAQYGPPYNSTADAAQAVGPISPQAWAGVSTPIDTAQDFVLRPLGFAAIGNPTLTTALQAYGAASADQQQTWLTNYSTALADATVVNA
ncbi:MAG TPA: hypothetical protein VGE81_04140, partial [Candidatus Limnocylindrales bacterium]